MALRDQKFIRRVRFAVTNPVGPVTTNYDFAVDNMRIGMQRETSRFEKLNGDLRTRLRWVRPVFAMNNRYIQRAASGTYDMTDVINALDSGTLQVTIQLLDIASGPDAMSPVEIVSGSSEVTTGIDRFKTSPSFDYTFLAKNSLTTIPAWYKFTKASPSALL